MAITLMLDAEWLN